MSNGKTTSWEAPPRPDWLAALNREGGYLDLDAVVPLDAASLIDYARQRSGLTDFGADDWQEPFGVFLKSLAEEAELTLMGRLMMRNDLLLYLSTRLQVEELHKRHPEILEEKIVEPMFIVGLPRSGTSILFELLWQDPDVGVPLLWEALIPCPPPEASTYDSDPRIAQADGLFDQWNRVTPEFAQIHEMRGHLPAECDLLMAPTFISDHLSATASVPSYMEWCAQADQTISFRYHKQILQVLQWKNPRKRWLLKAPAHLGKLPVLLNVYPDARIVHTHRDPMKSMASSASLMGTLYYMRSDQRFNAELWDQFLMGEATAQRLELVMDQREQGLVPAENIVDSRYQDLMDDPIKCIQGIYQHFGLSLTDTAKQRMQNYLADKPKGKFGKHQYSMDDSRSAERALFQRYQSAYNVPNEM
ncbi:MAG: sulfotransferase [Pseudomonadota bacterium]